MKKIYLFVVKSFVCENDEEEVVISAFTDIEKAKNELKYRIRYYNRTGYEVIETTETSCHCCLGVDDLEEWVSIKEIGVDNYDKICIYDNAED